MNLAEKIVAGLFFCTLGISVRIFLTAFLSDTESSFPWSTLIINAVACFLCGLFWKLTESNIFEPEIKVLIFTFFLGTFSTFSTFALDTAMLIKQGDFKLAALYLVMQNVICILAVFTGYRVTSFLEMMKV